MVNAMMTRRWYKAHRLLEFSYDSPSISPKSGVGFHIGSLFVKVMEGVFNGGLYSVKVETLC